MTTSYPGGIDSYTTKVNGVDTPDAAHINNLQDAVAAIETELGTDPAGAVATVSARIAALEGGDTERVRSVIIQPQAIFTVRPQIPLFRADAALTITRIHIHCNDTTPTSELAGDLKFADDAAAFANAVVIDICDTTGGVRTITTGFDDATVPSGKYIYFQMDAAPHDDISEIYLEVFYTYD